MPNEQQIIDSNLSKEYEYGFVSDIESETLPPGLNENIIRIISKKKDEPQWLLDWRLKAFELWKKLPEPSWANVKYEKTSTFFDFSGYIDKSVADKIYKALKGSGIKFNVDGI